MLASDWLLPCVKFCAKPPSVFEEVGLSLFLAQKTDIFEVCYGCIQTGSKYGKFVRFLTLFHYIKFLTVYAMSVNDVIVINNILVKKRTSFPILTQSECSLEKVKDNDTCL